MAGQLPVPANVQYWFTYCAQFNNAPGGNVLHLFNNGIPAPLTTPLVVSPPAVPYPLPVPAPFNGPSLISNPAHGQRPANQRFPNDEGFGVFIGFVAGPDPKLPAGNNSADPWQWCVVYGKWVHPKKGRRRKRPAPHLSCWRRRLTYTGRVTRVLRTQLVKYRDVNTIQALRGMDEAQALAWVQAAVLREQTNNPGEYDANLNHLRALQRAHAHTFIGPRRQALLDEYGI